MNIEMPISSQRQRLKSSQLAEEEHNSEEDLTAINDKIENDFISRAQLIRNLKFPSSNSKRIIVLPNNEGLGFRYDCYNDILRSHLSEKEFRDSVYELTKVCSLEFAKKLHRERSDPFKAEKSMLLWNVPLLIFAVVLFSLRVFDVVTDDTTFEIGLVLFGIDIAAVVVNFIRSQTKKPDLTSFTSSAYEQLTAKINELNNKQSNKGLKWILHPKLYWIEIQIK